MPATVAEFSEEIEFRTRPETWEQFRKSVIYEDLLNYIHLIANAAMINLAQVDFMEKPHEAARLQNEVLMYDFLDGCIDGILAHTIGRVNTDEEEQSNG